MGGLAALKTPMCYEDDDKNPNCPVCTKEGRILAKDLPFSHHTRSMLVCRITGETMNENNPPMLLPNGNVYSQNALSRMAVSNEGKITCPRTGEEFSYTSLQRL